MKLLDKDNQQKLTKGKDMALTGSQHQESEDVKENWNSLKAITYDSAVSVLGKPNRKHQDWFDDNNKKLKALLEERTNARVK